MILETVKETLTFSLSDRGGGGDGAEGGAAWVGRISSGHSHRVADPRCRVNGSDRFICKGRSRHKETVANMNYRKARHAGGCAYSYCEAE